MAVCHLSVKISNQKRHIYTIITRCMKAYIFIFAAFLLTVKSSNAQFNCQQTKQLLNQKVATAPINNNGKSDSLNILHYHLDLDMTKIQSGQLQGSCAISLSPKMVGITRVSLDFKSLTVDSVLLNNTAITTYSHAGGNILGIIQILYTKFLKRFYILPTNNISLVHLELILNDYKPNG